MSKTITISESLEKRMVGNIDASVARILTDNHPIDYNDEMIANIQLMELLGYDNSDIILEYENELICDAEYTAEYFSKLERPLEDFEAGFVQRLSELGRA